MCPNNSQQDIRQVFLRTVWDGIFRFVYFWGDLFSFIMQTATEGCTTITQLYLHDFSAGSPDGSLQHLQCFLPQSVSFRPYLLFNILEKRCFGLLRFWGGWGHHTPCPIPDAMRCNSSDELFVQMKCAMTTRWDKINQKNHSQSEEHVCRVSLQAHYTQNKMDKLSN